MQVMLLHAQWTLYCVVCLVLDLRARKYCQRGAMLAQSYQSWINIFRCAIGQLSIWAQMWALCQWFHLLGHLSYIFRINKIWQYIKSCSCKTMEHVTHFICKHHCIKPRGRFFVNMCPLQYVHVFLKVLPQCLVCIQNINSCFFTIDQHCIIETFKGHYNGLIFYLHTFLQQYLNACTQVSGGQ